MASAITLDGPGDRRDGPHVGDCKRVYNPRTKRHVQLCYVGKGRSKTGWQFVKTGAARR